MMEANSDVRAQVTHANPAQVTDAMVDAASAKYREIGARCNWQHSWPSEEAFREILTAAIGAGGQAVATDEMNAALDRFETAAFAKFANLPRGKADREKAITSRAAEYNASRQAILSALSQPHPADKRVVEALRETADALETLLSADPDMPTYQSDYDAADQQLERARAALAAKEGR